MKPYYEAPGVQIFHGDCREVLPSLGLVETCITDPPYGLGFMGKGWDHAVPGIEFWTAVSRVLKPGGYLLAFGGTRLWHRLAVAVEDSGFEIRDTLMWVYGQGFPKSHNLSGEWKGWGTALKPAWEPILMARKPLEGTVAGNVQAHGTGVLNIDGCRIPAAEGDRTDRVGGTAQKFGTNAYAQDDYSVNVKGSNSPANELGRWPANLALDDEAARLLDEQSGELNSGGTPARRNADKVRTTYGTFKGSEENPSGRIGTSAGAASRFFYTAKASRSERNWGCDGIEPRTNDFQRATSGLSQGKNPETGERSGKTMGPRANDHPTVKPLDLMRWLARLTKSPQGGTVLDPFMGSGSTLVAAREEFRPVIGIELDERYCEIAARRLSQGVLDFGAA